MVNKISSWVHGLSLGAKILVVCLLPSAFYNPALVLPVRAHVLGKRSGSTKPDARLAWMALTTWMSSLVTVSLMPSVPSTIVVSVFGEINAIFYTGFIDRAGSIRSMLIPLLYIFTARLGQQ